MNELEGFFSASDARVLRPLPTLVPRCGRCGLHASCLSPKMRATGQGQRRILVVGERPGRTEDRAGRQFVGESGRFLAEEMRAVGLDLHRDCWLTNAQICHDTNRGQKATTTEDCRPNLLRTIRELDPEVILLLGGDAVQSLVGHLWKADTGGIGRWVGWQVPAHRPNAWVCPAHNPAHLLREDDPVLRMDFRRHLAAVAALDGRPHPGGPPDHAGAVECVPDAATAAARIRALHARGGVVAFDYETNCLKPDGRDARIVCASVCWEGRETIAFPWEGDVPDAMRDLLVDPDVAKVGWNSKFEGRWTQAKLGVRVAGWRWDGMLTAHALDPRGGISGLKFQSFVRLGVRDYNHHVEPFLGGDGGGNALNTIHRVRMGLLLRYCALDSLLEMLTSRHQAAEVGVEL